ncbi:MAG TPA: HEAT repeat domain-containing protein [Terriglobales bacterium]|nr:HEAT repeat domain-containing protein [Terriglobales bacterium]
MLDAKQLKVLGLRFARGLQQSLRTAVMFSAEHQSVERPIQQSFQSLNSLLKETGQFTFGFVDNQVVLNNLITTDPSLKQLEKELLKRGVAAITFEPGLSLGRYRKLISLLSVPTKVIEDAGGLRNYLEANEVEGARIIAAAKNQKKDEQGDTILDTDSEAYIMSKQMAEEEGPKDFLDSIDALLESACLDPATRTSVLSDFAAVGSGGANYGVPIPMPNLVVAKDGAGAEMGNGGGSNPGVGSIGLPNSGNASGSGAPGGSGGLAGSGGTGTGWAAGHATGGVGGSAGGAPIGDMTQAQGDGAASPGGSGIGASGPGPGMPYATGGGTQGTAGGIGWGSGVGSGIEVGAGGGFKGSGRPGGAYYSTQQPPPGAAPGGGKGGQWGYNSFIELMENSVERSLLEEKGNPRKSYVALARILRDTGVESVLARMSPERQDEVRTLPPEQLAAEFIEDTALQWAGKRLKAVGTQSDTILVEEEVVRVLARSLQATHMADRLSAKLTKFIQDFAVPANVQEKIRDELRWTSLSSNKKYARLMEISHYSSTQFRRLMDLLRELVKEREVEQAAALANHYFDFLDQEGVEIQPDELSRAPELIRSMPLARVGFAPRAVERLSRVVLRDDVSEFVHFQAANALTVLAQSIATFEDFEQVQIIGLALERSKNRNPGEHKKCCVTGMSRLLPAASLERIVELCLLQRGDSNWARIAAMLLRLAAPASVEVVFSHLIKEQDAKNRLALLRLITQLGPAALQVACKYLEDERWYVVRNMCGVLSELRDPDLEAHMAGALQHSDPRVQQAAFTALCKNRSRGRGPVMAASLAKLAPDVLDQVLDELLFVKDPATIPDLERFVLDGCVNPGVVRKSIQVLTCIPGDETPQVLARLLRSSKLALGPRRMAMGALAKNQSPLARQLLEEFAGRQEQLSDEARLVLGKPS